MRAHRLPIVALLVLAFATESLAANFYASTTGTGAGDGSLLNPWDLQTALSQPGAVQPGDTIWVRGGTYRGSFTSALAGTSANPITVRAYRRERVILDYDPMAPCNTSAPMTCGVDATRCSSVVVPSCSHDVILWGLEFTYSQAGGRVSLPAGGCTSAPGCCYIDGSAPPLKPECSDAPAGVARSTWSTVAIAGPRVKVVNCLVHDAGTGLSPDYGAIDTEIYGTLAFNNGWVNPVAGMGQGIHLENRDVSFSHSYKRLRESILWNNFGFGAHAFTQIPRALQNVALDGAVAFNNGAPAASFFATDATAYAPTQNARYNNIYVASEELLSLISIRSSHSYQPLTSKETGGRIGSDFDFNADLTFEDNYFVSPGLPLTVDRWDDVRLQGNTLVGGATATVGDSEAIVKLRRGDCLLSTLNPQDPKTYIWDDNAYLFNGSGTTPFLKHWTSQDYLDFGGWKYQFTYLDHPEGFDRASTYATGLPTTNAVFVRPNAYEPGRAHVVVYNWEGLSAVSTDLSAAGLVNGQGFKIYNLQAFDTSAPSDYFGTVVASGNYNSSSPNVSIPMTDTTVTSPIGFSQSVASTLPQFGAFLVLPTPCGDGGLDAGEACDDGNLNAGDGCSPSCAVEQCYSCVGTPSVCVPNSLSCDDGLFCNGIDTCSAGVCMHSGSPCPGGNACLGCNEMTDLCLSPAGTACTDDNNACTADQCDALGGCQHDPISGPCSDNDACTDGDHCDSGSCANTGPADCDDDNVCTADSCDMSLGCQHSDISGPCDNGDACGGDTCQAGSCEPVSCPDVDVVVLAPPPMNIKIPLGPTSVTKTLGVVVRNADSVDREIALAVDAVGCPAGFTATADFDPGAAVVSSTLVTRRKTKKAKIPLVISSADFTSFNYKAPERCKLVLTASLVLSGGSNEPRISNNVATVEINVVDKNDVEQTSTHETTINSAKPAKLVIAKGKTSAVKTIKIAVGNADYKPAAEIPGDSVAFQASTSCGDITLGTPVCGATLTNSIVVPGGKTKVCKVTATATGSAIQTPDKLSPVRCTVTLAAVGPSHAEGTPHDSSNNSTELVLDVIDAND